MAPRGTPKPTPPIRHKVTKTSAPATVNPVLKQKTMSVTETTDNRTLLKDYNTTFQRTRTVNNTNSKEAKAATVPRARITEPKLATPKAKEKKSAVPPGSITKSGKKPAWKRRPKPAHSGIPLTDDMKKRLNKLLEKGNDL